MVLDNVNSFWLVSSASVPKTCDISVCLMLRFRRMLEWSDTFIGHIESPSDHCLSRAQLDLEVAPSNRSVNPLTTTVNLFRPASVASELRVHAISSGLQRTFIFTWSTSLNAGSIGCFATTVSVVGRKSCASHKSSR